MGEYIPIFSLKAIIMETLSTQGTVLKVVSFPKVCPSKFYYNSSERFKKESINEIQKTYDCCSFVIRL